METDEPQPAQEFLTEHLRWRAVEQARRPQNSNGEPVSVLLERMRRAKSGENVVRSTEGKAGSLRRKLRACV